jgi:hypothetical protein
MSLLQKLSLTALSAVLVIAGTNPAKAISLKADHEGLYTSTVANTQTITFDGDVTQVGKKLVDNKGMFTYSAPDKYTPTIVKGSADGQYATPAGDTTNYLTISNTGSNVKGNTGSVTIDFTKSLDYFGLYWGSVDGYNHIAFYNDDKLVQAFGGKDVPGTTASGNQKNHADNVFVNFFADKGETFNKVVMVSDSAAFETDNHTYRLASVPEPTAVLGLVAFAAIGVTSKRSRRRQQQA